MKPDIKNREDIAKLITAFYDKLLEDKLLAPIFTEVAQIKLSEHLPILYDFWESVLFQVGKYKRNAMEFHLDLHQMHRLEEKHFKRWLALFNETVDAFFEGDTANQAKTRALSIATVIKMKIDQLDRKRLEINN